MKTLSQKQNAVTVNQNKITNASKRQIKAKLEFAYDIKIKLGNGETQSLFIAVPSHSTCHEFSESIHLKLKNIPEVIGYSIDWFKKTDDTDSYEFYNALISHVFTNKLFAYNHNNNNYIPIEQIFAAA